MVNGDGTRLQAGMSSDQWTAAIRLQVALRDRLQHPVSLVDALEMVHTLIVDHGVIQDADVVRLVAGLEASTAQREAERVQAQRQIAATAGRKSGA